MRIVSDTHTNLVKKGERKLPNGKIAIERAEVPPGTPFDCPKEAADEKIAAGRARPADAKATEAESSPGGGAKGGGKSAA